MTELARRYFTNFIGALQDFPSEIQQVLTKCHEVGAVEESLLNDIEVGFISLLDGNKPPIPVEKISSSIQEVKHAYDLKLSQLYEATEQLEQMLQVLSQSKLNLYSNDGQLYRSLQNAFKPGFSHRIPASNMSLSSVNSPSRIQVPSLSSSINKSVRRGVSQNRRPSGSQIMLTGTKWLKTRRCTTSSGASASYRGVRGRAVFAAAASSKSARSKISERNHRKRNPNLDNSVVGASRTTTKDLPSPTSSSTSDSSANNSGDDYDNCGDHNNNNSSSGAAGKRRPASRSQTSSPMRSGRKRDGNTELSAASNTEDRPYCICNKMSYGDMIACDNKQCEIEWFHFACVDVKVRPKGRWYCPVCRGENCKVKRPDL